MIIDKDNIKILLIILILGLGIGYAYINSDLNINGTAQVNSANWDVHWANIAVTSGSVSGSNVVTQPTISNQTTVNYSVILSKPGDYYEFCVDAVNGGAMDAMIDGIDSKLNGATITTLPAYLNYTVTYLNGVELEPNHELLANTYETYKVRLEYRTDINQNQLPTSNQTLSLQFTVTYRQATIDSIEVPHPEYRYTGTLYDSSNQVGTTIRIGQAIPNGITQYTNAADALAALKLATNDNNIYFYLKHSVIDGIVIRNNVEFIITPTVANNNAGATAGTYNLRGFVTEDEVTGYCKSEYYNSSTGYCMSPYYESNKEILRRAFGSENCNSEYNGGTYKFLSCNLSNILSYAYSDGNVEAYVDSWGCVALKDGRSKCEIVYW